jgi:hypothetical protein
MSSPSVIFIIARGVYDDLVAHRTDRPMLQLLILYTYMHAAKRRQTTDVASHDRLPPPKRRASFGARARFDLLRSCDVLHDVTFTWLSNAGDHLQNGLSRALLNVSQIATR